ncbi:MAG: AAA family ATPase [Flavobacteriales bacterium TMED123]|nr:MAG: AAA family ATPase [Flavobacteriales bacterium TMED123]|tara:strand:+ start:2304 stop:3575 length:1272 start_codon:yes stop_codon:yes gene_type:complete
MQNIPLAERIRPKKISDVIGQKHLIGKNGTLKNAIENKVIPSMILWGPPGIGKTTLSNLIAEELERPFYTLSAINSGVKDVREVIKKASSSGLFGKDVPILFIDEIHRFSKAQQDSLLEAVEKGIITLIGATTENPSFEVISALLSRSQIYVLESLSKDELQELLVRAISQDEVLKKKNIKLKETESLIKISGGDARKILNILELVVGSAENKEVVITNDFIINKVQKNIVRYDKNGEQHYDIISAFIKSIRGNDPNAAVYWLARMIEGGEELKFIARRLVILASEDIGNANPTALVIANNCFQAVNTIGLPEARITLSQATIYLACSAKSNSAYIAINEAQEEVRKSGNLSVPLHLRNTPTKLMKELGYGKDYIYSHNNPTDSQEFLPEKLIGKMFYKPKSNIKETSFKEALKKQWKGKYNY